MMAAPATPTPSRPPGSLRSAGRERLVLASRSPRRASLLAQHGIAFDTADAGIEDDDVVRGRASPASWVASLAYLKAAALIRRFRERGESIAGLTVVGADTAVVKDGRLIGKAPDAASARSIITLLADGQHEVVTGVALVTAEPRERTLFTDVSRVRVGPLSPGAIDEYVAGDGWRGKAGAYNLEERVAAGWPITWEGDPTNVMGLPMLRLLPLLADFVAPLQRGGLATAQEHP